MKHQAHFLDEPLNGNEIRVFVSHSVSAVMPGYMGADSPELDTVNQLISLANLSDKISSIVYLYHNGVLTGIDRG